MVAPATTTNLRAVAVVLVVDEQAQSIAPVTPEVIIAPCTLGVNMIVLLAASLGRPASVAVPLVTVMAPLVLSMLTAETFLEIFSALLRALYSLAAAVIPAKPLLWKASLTKLFGELAAIIISDTLERTV